MKWKKIMAVPFRGVPEETPEDTILYADVFTREISESEHLFVDLYTTDRQRPSIRRAYTESDFGMWYVGDGGTAVRKIDNFPYGDLEIGRNTTTSPDTAVIPDESVGLIRSFTGQSHTPYAWHRLLLYYEEGILREKIRRREEKKRNACRQRDENMPAIPEDFRKWTESALLPEEYLYYKRHGSYADYFCSACGTETTKRIVPHVQYPDSIVDGAIEAPKSGNAMRCPFCGKWAMLKPRGRAKGVCGLSRPCYLIQKYGSGIVVRYFENEKYFSVDDKAYIRVTEVVRGFLIPGEKLQMDYHKHSAWTGQNFWDYVNLDGMANIVDKAGPVYPGSFRELDGTKWQFSALREYARACRSGVRAIRYLEAYRNSPCLEMAVKTGLTELAEDIVKGILRIGTGKPWEALGIRKDSMDVLIRHKGDFTSRKILRIEEELGQRWGADMEERLININPDAEALKHLLGYMSPHRMLKYTCGQSHIDPDASLICAGAIETLRSCIRTWSDYIGMRERGGYDLTNTVFLFPNNLRAAHDRMVIEQEKEKIDARKIEVKEKYPLIRRHYRGLRSLYFSEGEGFLIRPARSAEEIVEEGRILHHCVGGDGYLEKHNEGRSLILMLRHEEEPEIPFVTVEITPAGTILQWYGMYDKKPDRELIDAWLGRYTEHLKELREEAERPRIMALA